MWMEDETVDWEQELSKLDTLLGDSKAQLELGNNCCGWKSG
jgi:hypothetical protein